jgi:ketosteroid isomerase-like protein
MDNAQEKELQKALDDSARAYNSGDLKFFDFFAKDAVIFSAGSSESVKGRDAYREAFGSRLRGTKREVKILERTQQSLGDKAVVTQTAQIVHEGITANVRQTMVWGLTNEGWRVHHLHTALIGTPFSKDIPDSPGAIRVLNERIATVAAVLGVAQ